ncbi:hypothetical protein [Paraburkholderia atlantica]|uniref:hypothetical protein n=1 Tax=Paraburkholderia atlantica TaxID=2654982 RepID=UPI001808D15F|nr:hypothetical protein [Paraburkholderia atlantica]MBB5420608.1 hypothetical protein [Paraburkholderia atlantica]
MSDYDETMLDPGTGEIGGGRHGTSRSPGGPTSGAGDDVGRITTLTLASIDPAHRPEPHTVCEVCPAAVWMATPRDLKCVCRLMHYWSWETSEPTELTQCDGLAIASEREENS